MSITKAFEAIFKLKEKARKRDELLIELEASLITRSLKEASKNKQDKADCFYVKQLNEEARKKVEEGKNKMQTHALGRNSFLSCKHEGETPFELMLYEKSGPRIVCRKCALANMKDFQSKKKFKSTKIYKRTNYEASEE